MAADYRISRLIKGGWHLAGGHGAGDPAQACDVLSRWEAASTAPCNAICSRLNNSARRGGSLAGKGQREVRAGSERVAHGSFWVAGAVLRCTNVNRRRRAESSPARA